MKATRLAYQKHGFIFLLMAIALIGCKNSHDENASAKGKPKELNAEAYIAVPQPFSSELAASGSLIANEEIDIHPEISGRVTGIYFKEGCHVRKGQLLVQLFDGEIKAQIQKLKSQQKLQQNILNRQEELLKIGGISKQDYETTETQIASINADIAYAEAQLRSTRIIAPFDGTIGIRSISEGAVISPATVISALQQTHQLKIDFNVPEQYLKSINIGNTVHFSVSGRTDTLTGKIAAIDAGAEAGTRTVKVRAIVPNKDSKLIAGSFANVIIPIKSEADAILIPSQAVIPTTKEKKVARIKNGKVDMAVVKLGQRTSDKVEILQGLAAGDTIILTGLMQAKPGMDVKVTRLRS
ncbi:hypothetical protein CAP35_00030 [Chitinophagaceae bacterium IBVUCB1]|nr:hypothetical protein CAP35_00030 [Chitinophagaceae bacterium IBVUCB1]